MSVGVAERGAIHRVDERVERHADRPVLGVGETAGRVAGVGDDDRLVRDRGDAAGAQLGIVAEIVGVRVQLDAGRRPPAVAAVALARADSRGARASSRARRSRARGSRARSRSRSRDLERVVGHECIGGTC